MLPTSHCFPIKLHRAELDVESQIEALSLLVPDGSPAGLEARNPLSTAPGMMTLTEAFAEFISASARLERSYRELQVEVSDLSEELAARNRALNSSLAENERMRLSLERTLDSMPCGVLVVDSAGTILTINPEGRRLLGIDLRMGGNREPESLDEIPALGHLNLQRFFGGTAADTEQEFSIPAPGGKRWLELRNRRLSGFSKGLEEETQDTALPSDDRTILILRDITAQKQMEQEREAALRAMTLAEITTILAHEIRNPLASLELFAGLIAGDGVTSPVWISHMRAGIRSLSGTVNNVLSFHGACQMGLSAIDLRRVIEAGIDFVRPIAEQAGVSLRWVDAATDTASSHCTSLTTSLTNSIRKGREAVLILGSESGLQQVVLNLVSNAIRHTPAGGSVTVSLKISPVPCISPQTLPGASSGTTSDSRGGYAVVEFRDTGCGIPPRVASRIFEPGFSAGGDRPGLGLAVCRMVMEKHGGRIAASSAPGSGAILELEFPLL